MGEARTIMDQATEAFTSGDIAKGIQFYAPEVVVVTPDQGEVKGAEAFAAYVGQFNDAFPDQRYESRFSHEDGNTAIDEGYFVGTNTGELQIAHRRNAPCHRQVSKTPDLRHCNRGRWPHNQPPVLLRPGRVPDPAGPDAGATSLTTQ
jgi:ketosteroid isomerase-like protein